MIRTLLILVLIISFAGSLPFADAQTAVEPLIQLLEAGEDGLTFTVSVPWQALSVEPVELDGESFSRLSMPSYHNMTEAGMPALPFLTRHIAIPFGVTLELHVSPGRAHTRQLEYPLQPAPTQIFSEEISIENGQPLDTTQMILAYPQDRSVYSKMSAFPGNLAEVTNIGQMRQQRIAGISIFPVQYEPMAGQYLVYESLQVEVRFRGSPSTALGAPRQESPYYEAVFADLLMNYEQSLAWRMPGSEQERLDRASTVISSTLPWDPPEPGWRISISQDGLYQLSYAELAQAGLDLPNLNPLTLQLFNLGEEVAIFVTGEDDEHFDEGDAILFYGQSISNKYSSENIYWLTYGNEQGLRMSTRDVTPLGAAQALSGEAQRLFEVNTFYLDRIPGDDMLERYHWSNVTNSSQFSYEFDLFEVGDGSGKFSLELAGISSNDSVTLDHHAVIKLNGTQIGDLFWDGKSWMTLHEDLPANLLLEGQNTLSINLPGDTGAGLDWIVVDRAALAYDRLLTAQDDLLVYTYDLAQETLFELAGFTSADVILLDISTPSQPRWLENFAIGFDDPTYTLAFQDGSTISGLVNYLAVEGDSLLPVEAITQDHPSNLGSGEHGADHIIITPADFFSQAEALALHRQGPAMRSLVVDLQDIYDEFGYGITSAGAIKAFLAYAYHNWAEPAPSFVVLVGDGHYNPKGYNPAVYGAWRESYLPPYLATADPTGKETAADNRYVTLVGDDLIPEMMLGRLAVNTSAHATALINKIIAYETQPTEGGWRSQVLAVADNPDSGGNFPALSQILLSTSLPETYAPERIYLGTNPYNNVTDAREAIISAINSGKALVNYIGHGAPKLWAGYDEHVPYSGHLLSIDEVTRLTNQDMYPFVVSMSCRDGYYINPHPIGGNQESLAEVITRAEAKGAVASWSPTGDSLATGHDIINQALFIGLFEERLQTLGQATLRAQAELWAGGIHLDLIDTYLLFGDPATNFLRQASIKQFYLPLILNQQ